MRTLLTLILAGVVVAPAFADDRADLDARAKALGLKAHARIAKDALPGARLVKGGDGAVGETRIGGRPDLPARMKWPTCKGARLGFLAQVNLADLAAVAPGAVPGDGVLTVFGNVKEDSEGFVPIEDTYGRVGKETCVIVRALRGVLTRRAIPHGAGRVENMPVRLQPNLMVVDPMLADARYGLKSDRKAQDDYWELFEESRLGRLERVDPEADDGPLDQVLGSPEPVQDSPLYGCGKGQSRPTYRLLLQLDLGIGDGGVLYLSGTPADLRAGRFDRVCAEFQEG